LGGIAPGLLVVGVFYLAMAAILCPLLTSVSGRRVFCILLAVGLPVLYFAVFIFEAGSQERYMPLYPFLAWAAAWSMTVRTRFGKAPVIAGLVLLALMTAANVRALSRVRAEEKQAAQERRVGALKDRVGDAGMIAILSNRDDLMAFSKTYLFHPLNRPNAVPVYEVIEVGTASVETWRERFARRALEAWGKHAEVWVSKRVMAERPAPEWQWVEGDDPRIAWPQIPRFFHELKHSSESGGADGFVLLEDSPANREIFERLGRRNASYRSRQAAGG